MATPVTLGATRQMWFAKLTDATPQWSFLEDPAGTTKRAAQYGRAIRLGDPINTGPNSTWHQLTWEGGEGQDIWNDKQMYQWGDADVLSYSGKFQQWPGFQSWAKFENLGNSRWMCFSQGSRADLSEYQEPLYCALGDSDPSEPRAGGYLMMALQGGYLRGDTRSVQYLDARNEPYRFIIPMLGDDGVAGISMVATATHLYVFAEQAKTMTEDTGAPATTAAGYQYMHNSGASFNGAFYYCHGNRLMKRVGKPPFGIIGTHTVVHQVGPATWLRGMVIWNNRIYFGAQYPNGRSAIYVTDGATVTKAFDFPQQFRITKLRSVAGSLYILGQQSSDIHGNSDTQNTYGNIVQQLWRYDGTGLKKLWQQGKFSDGQNHWASDLTDWNGMVVWGSQGTFGSASKAKAGLVMYDPVRDAIVRGPGIVRDAANIGGGFGQGLWVQGISTWHNTLVCFFKDDTIYAHNLQKPGMIASMRPEGFVRNDLRWHTADQVGDVAQFKGSTTDTPTATIVSSEYHGEDDVATEQKTWLSVRVRCRFTGANTTLKVYIIQPTGTQVAEVADATLIGTINNTDPAVKWRDSGFGAGSSTIWKDVLIPVKDGTGSYIQSQKIQVMLVTTNTSTNYDDTSYVQVDDVAVQWQLAPHTVRQWQARVPVTEAQATLAGTANSLSTADTLAQKLEDLFFAGEPIKFWEPSTATATPANNAYVEARIVDFQRQESRLASNETGLVGYVTLTLVENLVL